MASPFCFLSLFLSLPYYLKSLYRDRWRKETNEEGKDIDVERKDGEAGNERNRKNGRKVRRKARWGRRGRGGGRGKKEERIARRRYIMSGISRKIVSGARTAKMSVR